VIEISRQKHRQTSMAETETGRPRLRKRLADRDRLAETKTKTSRQRQRQTGRDRQTETETKTCRDRETGRQKRDRYITGRDRQAVII
jgi:hypothetical protein